MIAPSAFKQVYAGTPLENFDAGWNAATADCQAHGNHWCYYHEFSNEYFSHTLAYQNGYIKGVDLYTGHEDPYTDYGIVDASGNYVTYPYRNNNDGNYDPGTHSSNDKYKEQSNDSANPLPLHCDTGGWPSCYNTGYNAGLDDGKKGLGNGNCIGRHSDNFCSGYYKGWQDAHSTNNVKSTVNNTNDQGQTSSNNNTSIQNSNPKNIQKFSPNNNPTIIIAPNISPNISPHISSNSGSASTSNTTSGSGSLSGSDSGSASNAGHNK